MTPEQKAKELIEKFGELAPEVINKIIPIVESVKEVGEYWQKVKTIIESSPKL